MRRPMRETPLTEGLEYKRGRLRLSGSPLEDAAEKFGTPLYVYSPELMLARLARVKAAFKSLAPLVCYAMKANSSLALCRRLAAAGAGVEVVSGGELSIALKAGFQPRRVIFSGVGKTRVEIRQGLRSRVLLFNVESLGELDAIEAEAARTGVRAGVSIRINPDIDAHTHRHITTGLAENKFGLPVPDSLAAFRRAARSPNLRALGLHVHLGSQIASPVPYAKSARLLAGMISRLESEGHPVKYVDVGGGFGLPYGGPALDLKAVARTAAPLKRKGRTLIVEPGRFLVAECGILLTRIQYVKRTRARTFVVLDAGMNDLIRPALYGARHPLVPVFRRAGPPQRVEFVGPICETSDTFGEGAAVDPAPGDLWAVLLAGAYGFSMASRYNGRPLPAEAVAGGGGWRLARKRETHAELTRLEA
jgi:diaminopimelate decarboxylase